MGAGIYDSLSGVKRWFAELSGYVYGFIGSGYGFVPSLLRFNSDEFGIATQLWTYISIIGIGITIIMFLADLDKTMFMMQGNFTWSKFFEPFWKFIVALLIISNGGAIVSWIVGFNNWFINITETLTVSGSFASVPLDSSSMNACIVAMATGMDFWTAIFATLAMFIVFVVGLVPALVMAYNALTRKFEFILRIGFAPIAMADVYKGMDSTSVRYIKKLLALVFYGGGMVLVLKIGAGLISKTLNDLFSFMPNLMSGASTVAGDSIGGQIVGTILVDLMVGSGLTVIGQVLVLVIGVLAAIVILFAELGACSMIKQACNDVLGII